MFNENEPQKNGKSVLLIIKQLEGFSNRTSKINTRFHILFYLILLFTLLI